MGIEVASPKQPPDFSQWKHLKKMSGHIYLSDPEKMYEKDCADFDPQIPSWAGYIHVFEKDGIGVGRDYHFFGKELRFKYWGMKGEQPLYSHFAFLWPSGAWEVFSTAHYKAGVTAIFGEKVDSKKVVAVRLKLYRNDSNDSKLAGSEMIVKR